MTESRASPVHLHVEEDVPVHIHMKRQQKKLKEEAAEERGRSNRRHRANSSVRSRSVSERLPWVPAPALTTKVWSPMKGVLADKELDLLHADAANKQKELDTDDELWANAKARACEKKLGSLMTEVSSLKSEVDLQRTLREADKKDRALDESFRIIESQEAELQQTQKALHDKEREMRRLRDSASSTRPKSKSSSGVERDRLLRLLVETELDAQAASEQALTFRDVAQSMLRDGRLYGLSAVDALRPLEQHRDLLLQKFCDFDETNRRLRELLRVSHGDAADMSRLEEQRGLLVEKLTIADEENEQLRSKLKECEKRLGALADDLEQQEQISRATSSELQQTSARLQVEAHMRDAELSQLAARAARAEQEAAATRAELVAQHALIEAAENKYKRDKDGLKRSARVSKQRASASEENARQLNSQLEDTSSRLGDALKSCDTLRLRIDCLAAEKTGIAAENVVIKSRLTELEARMTNLIESHKEKQDVMATDLRLKCGDISSLRAENDRLKMNAASLESRLDASEAQCRSLRTDLRHTESTVDDMKQHLSRARSAAEESSSRLHDAEVHAERLRNEGQAELSKVRQRMESRLSELEPLPELLKTSEQRLSTANERLASLERQNSETMVLLAELTAKAEKQSAELASWKEHYQTLDTSTQARLNQLQSKLSDSESRNTELLLTLSRREEALTHTTVKLEHSTQDSSNLARQLEQVRTDFRKAQDEAAERAAYKEKALLDRARAMEEQLASAKADLARVRRDKEEADRKLNARIFDLKERLEQSHSSNKSMQNYVQFLKSSYANVFGDAGAGCGTSAKSHPKTYQH